MKWFKRKKKAKCDEVPTYDPLNPHGDGTMRAGDPIFDAVMRGNSVIGNINDKGEWEYEEVSPDER